MSSPKPKKAKAHHSSFIHRIHQRHDERHHPGEDRHPEQRPLLEEDHPDSASDVEPDPEEHTPTPSLWQRSRVAFSKTYNTLVNTTTQFSNAVNMAVSNGTSRAVSLGKRTSKMTKDSLFHAGSMVKRNPKRSLVIACGVMAVTSIGEAVELYRHYRISHSNTVCTTSTCVESAYMILQSLHPSHQQMNPCDDFYSYVCGGFEQSYELKEDQSEVSRESLMFDNTRHDLRRFLEQDAAIASENGKQEIIGKARDAYKACRNQQKLREYGLKPLKGLTDDIKMLFSSGKGTVRKTNNFQTDLNAGTSSRQMLTYPYLHMLKMGVEAFVSFEVKPDAMFPQQQAIYVQPSRPIGHVFSQVEAFDEHKLMKEYQDVIEGVLPNFIQQNTNRSLTLRRSSGTGLSMRELARGIVRLETKMNTILPPSGELKNMTKSYNVRTYHEFDKVMPFLSAGSIVQDLAPPKYNSSTLILTSPRYLEELSQTLAVTPVEVLQAFCIWKVIQVHADRVEDEVLGPWKRLSNTLEHRNLSKHGSSSHVCVDSVDDDLGWAVSRILADTHFSPQVKDLGSTIVQNVKTAIYSRWPLANWVDEQDRPRLRRLTQDLSLEVGYPAHDPNVESADSLSDYYRNVIISNDTFLENRISAAKNKLYHQWSQLANATQVGLWSKPSTLTGAYHDTETKQAFFPAAMMQTPLFNTKAPSYLLYSTLGIPAGHQIAHLLMSNMLYDNHTAQTLSSDWSHHTEAGLQKGRSCFQKQYNKYSVEGPNGKIFIDSKASVDENMADAGAVRAAYLAWSDSEIRNPSLRLPGLFEYTQSQLFWLSYGTQLCSKMTTEIAQQDALHGHRLPANIRIKGTVANSPEFMESFSCPMKEPVCELW